MLDVLFLSPHCDPQADLGEPDAGGQCVYEHELALALSRHPDVRVTTLCRDTGRREATTVVNDRYTIHRISCGPAGFVRKEEIEAHLHEFADKASSSIQDPTQVLLHAHYWDGGKTALLLLSRYDHPIPLVWTPHSLGTTKRRSFCGEKHEKTYNFIPRITWESYTLFASDRVIVSSQQEKEELIRDYCLAKDCTHILPPGIDVNRLERIPQDTARERLNIPIDGKVLLCFGRLTPFKGFHHAIRAFEQLKKSYTSPVVLVICGGSKDGGTKEEQQYKQELMRLATELGVADSVLFRPAVSYTDVNVVYSSADVLIVPSEHEPFGLIVLEAMAFGLPVVASSTAGSSHVITHNESGALVDVQHPERIAGYVRAFLKDQDLYEKVVTNARERVREEFSWEQRGKLYLEIYTKAYTDAIERASFRQTQQHLFFLQKNLN